MSFAIPVGIDFADGVTSLPAQPTGAGGSPLIIGTPLPTAELYIYSNTPLKIEEGPGSPEIERAEQCTCRHTLKMLYATSLGYWSVMGRGVVVTDTAANVWRVLSSSIKRIEGTFCEFSYVMESISFDSPPDDFSLQEVSMDLDIIKHPRYAWALSPYVTDAGTCATVGDTNINYQEIKETIIRMIQTYIDSPFFPSATMVNGLVQSTIMTQVKPGPDGNFYLDVHYPNPNYVSTNGKAPATPVNWDGTTAALTGMPNCQFFIISVPFTNTATNSVVIALAAAYELLTKLWRKEDTPYIAGYEVTHTQYFFAPVYLNPGGYIEDVRWAVPQYFMSPFNNGIIPRGYQGNANGGDSSVPAQPGQATIFDQLPYINPQCYAVNGVKGGPLSISCLRTSDDEGYERTWFKVTHKWKVACIGKWDSDLYTKNNRPQNANDFNKLPSS